MAEKIPYDAAVLASAEEAFRQQWSTMASEQLAVYREILPWLPQSLLKTSWPLEDEKTAEVWKRANAEWTRITGLRPLTDDENWSRAARRAHADGYLPDFATANIQTTATAIRAWLDAKLYAVPLRPTSEMLVEASGLSESELADTDDTSRQDRKDSTAQAEPKPVYLDAESDGQPHPPQRLDPSDELKRTYRDPDNYWRNVWLYEQRKAGKTNAAIRSELAERAQEFAPLETDNALRTALRSIAIHHHWPELKGRSGRPKKSASAASPG